MAGTAPPPLSRGGPDDVAVGSDRGTARHIAPQGAIELPVRSAGSPVQRPDPVSPGSGGSIGAASADSDEGSSVTAAAAGPGGGGAVGSWAARRHAVDPAINAQWERLTDAERDAAWEAQQEAWDQEDEEAWDEQDGPGDPRTQQELWAEFLGGRTLQEVQGDFNGAPHLPPSPHLTLQAVSIRPF